MPVRFQFFPAVFLFMVAIPAAADPVTIVSSSRFVLATANTGCCSGPTSDAKHDLDNMAATALRIDAGGTALGQAFMLSSISETDRFFVGQGTVSSQLVAVSPGGGAYGETSYRLTVNINEPQNYRFAGTFLPSGVHDFDDAYWNASITDDNAPPHAPLILDLGSQSAFTGFRTGTLSPGRYDFWVDMASTTSFTPGGATTSEVEDFTLEFSDVPPAPTPEPASMLLLGSGGVLLLVTRRRIGLEQVRACLQMRS